jgi:putative redox protein
MDMRVSFPGGKRVDAELGDFVIRTDQSRKSGGEGSAPEPFAYCLAALGTCAGIYVLSYLQARDLPTEGVEIVQRFERAPGRDAMARVGMKIVLPPTIDPKHHKPIIRSAEQCAVKKLIEQKPEFTIEVQTAE